MDGWAERVVDNLLSRARTYSQPRRSIRAIVDRSDTGVRCVVLDEGEQLMPDEV